MALGLAPGTAHEPPQPIPTLERRYGILMRVMADSDYSSRAFPKHIWSLGPS